ncbi:glutamyl-tRNA synthetase [Ascosphaera apis ARSEF 7405]|uniref:glutamate--tRNA ligase n=1 Tax=Ascosphaera apis ARSEF 7405 TaxID=392613 RepID=A0A168A4Q2_9EURO|nr:glutamyl-tRNA synthetase [Ascosphaera apis ARSEF 7405]
MSASLTIANKANAAFTLPALVAVNHLKHVLPDFSIDTTFEPTETVGADSTNKVILTTADGKSYADDHVLYYLRDTYPALQSGNKAQVDEWIARSAAFKPLDFKSLEQPLKELESHLVLRTYIVGFSLTLADLTLWATLRGNRVTVASIRRNPNCVSRWFSFIEATNPWLNAAVTDLNAAAAKKKAAASAAGGSYNIGLKDTQNGVVTRFPPEPSGYLHIGHAKAALLNDYFAHEQFKGTLICRFDDTNPSKEKEEFEESIKHDLALLGIFPDKVSFSSDYFQQMYEYCIQMISDGKAYADDTPKEKMQQERFDGIASARRDSTVAESLAHFAEMKTGSEEGQRWCIRAKISVDDPNKALRDPVIYRVNLQPHHRTGTQWKIYPNYDFCVAILDALEGVTHALRTTEYGDRNALYKWMQNALGLRSVNIWEFARFNLIKTVLSKRKLTKFVDEGVVWGWDDPRMPTIRGIRRRGMTVPALREFILKQGPSRNVVNLDWTSFWATNKRYIDPIAARYTAVETEGMVDVAVSGVDGVTSAEKPKHAKNKDLGNKKVVYSRNVLIDQADAATFKEGEEVTFMNWGNVIIRSITKDTTTNAITHIDADLHLEGDVKKTEKKVTWLSKDQDLVSLELVDFDYLITKDKIEKDENVEDYLNPKTEFRSKAVADCNVAAVKKGDIIQFDRKGFYIVDEEKDGKPAVLFAIPTGKTA